jgi:hypothetical protein
MYLALKELVPLFSKVRGAQEDLPIQTVTDVPRISQPKGLYFPLDGEADGLKEAIANGAIAAVWEIDKEIPAYTPNYFPLFFTADMTEAIQDILKYYLEKLDGEIDTQMNTTNFIFFNHELLNKKSQTYDIAGMLNKLPGKCQNDHLERRG